PGRRLVRPLGRDARSRRPPAAVPTHGGMGIAGGPGTVDRRGAGGDPRRARAKRRGIPVRLRPGGGGGAACQSRLHRGPGPGTARPGTSLAGLVRARRTHGVEQLPGPVAAGHVVLPWLRPRPVGHGPRRSTRVRAGVVRRADAFLPLVAVALPIRPARVAVACGDLRALAAVALRLTH